MGSVEECAPAQQMMADLDLSNQKIVSNFVRLQKPSTISTISSFFDQTHPNETALPLFSPLNSERQVRVVKANTNEDIEACLNEAVDDSSLIVIERSKADVMDPDFWFSLGLEEVKEENSNDLSESLVTIPVKRKSTTENTDCKLEAFETARPIVAVDCL